MNCNWNKCSTLLKCRSQIRGIAPRTFMQQAIALKVWYSSMQSPRNMRAIITCQRVSSYIEGGNVSAHQFPGRFLNPRENFSLLYSVPEISSISCPYQCLFAPSTQKRHGMGKHFGSLANSRTLNQKINQNSFPQCPYSISIFTIMA